MDGASVVYSMALRRMQDFAILLACSTTVFGNLELRQDVHARPDGKPYLSGSGNRLFSKGTGDHVHSAFEKCESVQSTRWKDPSENFGDYIQKFQ